MSMNPCSVVPGFPKIWVTPSTINCSIRARLADIRGMFHEAYQASGLWSVVCGLCSVWRSSSLKGSRWGIGTVIPPTNHRPQTTDHGPLAWHTRCVLCPPNRRSFYVVGSCRLATFAVDRWLHAAGRRQLDSPVARSRHRRGDLQPHYVARTDDLVRGGLRERRTGEPGGHPRD